MLPLTAKEIPAVFQQARAAQAKGDLAGALSMYERILTAKPDLAEVHFNVAQIAAAQGRAADALAALDSAAKLKPAEPAIWSAMIDVATAAKDQPALKDIARRLPKSGVSGVALQQLMERLGSVGAEEKALKAAIKANKNSAAAYGQYGSYLVNQGRAAEAVSILKKAVKLGPKSPQARLAFGYACLRTGDLETARTAFAKAASLGLKSAQLFLGQGRVALAQKDDEAVEYFEAALAVDGSSAEVHRLTATALQAARREDEAFAAFEAALALEPENTRLMAEKAALLQSMGKADAAREIIKRALMLEPENGSLFMLYASTGKLAADDPVMAQARALYDSGRDDRHLAFAVSRGAEAPFEFLKRANDLSRSAFPYDFAVDQAAVVSVRKAWANRTVKQWDAAADASPAPIFVTGMPRSGTTLVEQIIAAHSDVASAGEVGILGRYLREVPQVPDMDLIRQRYWKMLQARFPGVGRVTDKSIATYVNIGFIKTVLPSARIVVVRRDPRDNALSIYKNMFADGQHRYSNDLADIARFMRLFEKQVAFWDDAAPGSFTTIRYDDIIAEPEAQSRKLIADVGLDWEDACLSFYDNTARVDTLSNVQVRQPIYASSVGAWEKFEAELAPFIQTYGAIQG